MQTAPASFRNLTDDSLVSGLVTRFRVCPALLAEATTDADSLDKEGLFIVEDSAGGFYLVGRAGLEPATKAL